MRSLILAAFVLTGLAMPGRAQDACGFGSDDPLSNLAKALSEAKSCEAAVAKIHECAWGSSADTQLAPIVISKCEKTFFYKLSPAAKKAYGDEMQLCAYEYAQQQGTMYMSAAALCQVDVAARFAADPITATKLCARASFDCPKAQTRLEKAICSDVSLGHADIVLSRVYSRLLQYSDENDKSSLIESERQWLQRIPARCGLSAPPFSRESVDCLRGEFENRFMTLDSCEEGIPACLRDADVQSRVRPTAPTPRASFDCETPSSALEIVICADADLGQLDIELAQAYRDAKKIMIAEQQKDLIESERQWLRFVSRTCPLGAVGGIPSVITRSCVRSAFQTRIQQLQMCPQKEHPGRISCLNDFHVSEKNKDVQ